MKSGFNIQQWPGRWWCFEPRQCWIRTLF